MKATAHPVASHTTRPTTKSNSAPTTAKLRRRIAHSTAVVALTTKLIEATAVVLDFEPQQLVFSSSALLMSIWGTVLSGCWDSARVLQFWIRRFKYQVPDTSVTKSLSKVGPVLVISVLGRLISEIWSTTRWRRGCEGARTWNGGDTLNVLVLL